MPTEGPRTEREAPSRFNDAAPAEARLRAQPAARERLDTLDGMRGLAALAVVAHHFSARWAVPLHPETLYPHGDLFASIPGVAYYGKLGVLLFFLISGFVIMMTLERSYGILDFSVRRIARLWPAMLVCATLSTIIINSSDIASYYSGAEEWAVHPLEYFSSIFFVSPDVVSTLFGHADAQWVEGVYWTLWAEVRFYILIALIFLVSPRSWFFWLWAVTQAVSTGFQLATLVDPDIVESVSALFIVFQPRFLCWFSLGLCGYMFWTRRLSAAVTAIAALAAVAVLASAVAAMGDDRPAAAPDGWSLLAVYCLVFGTFALFLIGSPLLRPLRWRPLLAVGLASYPLYLFHERVGMAGLKYTSEIGLAPWLGVLLVVTAVVVAALIIHKIVEVPAKRALTRVGEPMVRKLEKEYRCLRFSQTAQPTRRPA